MTMPNAEVANRFVSGMPAKGSHFEATISTLGTICNSYSTRIACVKDGRLFLTTEDHSVTTMQHKRHITSAWGRRQVAKGLPYDAGVFLVPDLFGMSSDVNVAHWVNKASDHMARVFNNRCMPHTRYFAFTRVHDATRRAAEIFYLLYPSPPGNVPTLATTHRLKAFTELCAAVPVHEAPTAEEARLSPEQIVTIRAVTELMKE